MFDGSPCVQGVIQGKTWISEPAHSSYVVQSSEEKTWISEPAHCSDLVQGVVQGKTWISEPAHSSYVVNLQFSERLHRLAVIFQSTQKNDRLHMSEQHAHTPHSFLKGPGASCREG